MGGGQQPSPMVAGMGRRPAGESAILTEPIYSAKCLHFGQLGMEAGLDGKPEVELESEYESSAGIECQ